MAALSHPFTVTSSPFQSYDPTNRTRASANSIAPFTIRPSASKTPFSTTPLPCTLRMPFTSLPSWNTPAHVSVGLLVQTRASPGPVSAPSVVVSLYRFPLQVRASISPVGRPAASRRPESSMKDGVSFPWGAAADVTQRSRVFVTGVGLSSVTMVAVPRGMNECRNVPETQQPSKNSILPPPRGRPRSNVPAKAHPSPEWAYTANPSTALSAQTPLQTVSPRTSRPFPCRWPCRHTPSKYPVPSRYVSRPTPSGLLAAVCPVYAPSDQIIRTCPGRLYVKMSACASSFFFDSRLSVPDSIDSVDWWRGPSPDGRRADAG
eukprot:gene10885-biopygen10911